ncbi:hypothetical protein [Silvanigrella aquatica]|uniref:Uncharacterized protein n=1 Tax=Silvanigrella aquatica TaxID=1915309 RepID=A0A1L4CXQ2_9BACT|nr:hypothetical protein [Silvanigrella aquatica]APJ02733.1 hypothetical protein AXG55_01845 [Silvanigrella aquatica]
MKNYYFKIILYLFILNIANTSFAKENVATKESPNRFTLTNGYFESSSNSNEGMAYFPMSVYETYDWIFRKLSLDTYGIGRFLSLLTTGIFQYYYFNTTYIDVPFHEFGHATRYRSYGINNITYYVDDNHSDPANSFFEMVIKRANYPNQGASTQGFLPNPNPTALNTYSLISTAGGMNNEILLSKLIAERIYDRGGSVPDFFFYLKDRLSPYDYVNLNPTEVTGGDPQKIESKYSNMGKNITRTNMSDGYLFSLVASGSFYSMIFGDLKYLWNGDQNVKTLEFFGISLPDFYQYINSKGLSMESVIHFRATKNLNFGFSYEAIYLGDNYNQFTPDFRYNWDIGSGFFTNFIIKPQMIIGYGNSNTDLGGSILTELEGKYLGLFLKYTNYNTNTLYGERNIPLITQPNEILGGIFSNLL